MKTPVFAQGSDAVMVFIESGSIVALYDSTSQPLFAELGASEIRRASHVEPCNAALRFAFHFLRSVFGESGTVAEWTRNFRGSWRINMSPVNGPILSQHYSSRAEAITAEVEWFNAHGRQ